MRLLPANVGKAEFFTNTLVKGKDQLAMSGTKLKIRIADSYLATAQIAAVKQLFWCRDAINRVSTKRETTILAAPSLQKMPIKR